MKAVRNEKVERWPASSRSQINYILTLCFFEKKANVDYFCFEVQSAFEDTLTKLRKVMRPTNLN